MKFYIQSISAYSPMFSDWPDAIKFFQGENNLNNIYDEIKLPKAELLSPGERRRVSRIVNLALNTAYNAQKRSQVSMDSFCKVFSCSNGDSDIFDYLCHEVSQDDVLLSPTKFHQSLHNSVAGYWDICSSSFGCSTSISAGDYSFIAGLIESVLLAINKDKPVLYVCYDLAPTPRLKQWINIPKSMAVAFVIDNKKNQNLIAECELEIGPSIFENTVMSDPMLEEFRTLNPAAASLPLLQYLANKSLASKSLASKYLGKNKSDEKIYFDFHQHQQVSLRLISQD